MKKQLLSLALSLFFVFGTVNAANISNTARNKEVIIQLFTMANQHQSTVSIGKLFSANAVIESTQVLTNLQHFIDNWNVAFPDHQTKIITILAQNNYVFTYTMTTGTQTGEFLGIAPTHKKTTKISYDVFAFNDAGKIIQFSQQWNELEIMTQLGYIVL